MHNIKYILVHDVINDLTQELLGMALDTLNVPPTRSLSSRTRKMGSRNYFSGSKTYLDETTRLVEHNVEGKNVTREYRILARL